MKLFSILCVWLTILSSVEADKPVMREEKAHEEGKVHVALDSNGHLTQQAHDTKVLARAATALEPIEAVKPVTKDGKTTKVFDFDEEEEQNDVALDELEAMTIQAALAGKAPPPPPPPPPRRRRDPPRRRRAPPPPVNCEWGPWTEGECSKTCGGGKRTDTRVKTRQETTKIVGNYWRRARDAGNCPGESSLANQECNDEDCPTTTTLMTTTVVKAFASRRADVSWLAYVGLSMIVWLNFK